MRGFKMMKIEGNTPRFMTSRTQLAIWGSGTFLMFANGVMKFLMGQLFFGIIAQKKAGSTELAMLIHS